MDQSHANPNSGLLPDEQRLQQLIHQLGETERQLLTLMPRHVDAVLDPLTAAPFLLRQAQLALQASEARYRRLFGRMAALIFELAPDGTFRFVNEAVARVLGYTVGDVEGIHWHDLFPRERHGANWERMVQLCHDGDLTNYELVLQSKQGHEVIVDLTTANRYADDGTLQAIVGCAIDMTERRRAEQHLEELTQYHSSILNAIGDGVIGIDRHGLVTFVNPAASTLLGWSSQELHGIFLHGVLQPVDTAGVRVLWEQSILFQVLRDGQERRAEDAAFWTRADEYLPVSYVVTPLRQQNVVSGAVMTFKDSRPQKQAAEAMRKQIEAQEAVRLRDEFLSIAAHELKTPVASLYNYAQLLQRRALRDNLLPEREQQVLSMLLAQGQRLSTLISTVFDLSRFQLGVLTLNAAPLDLNAFMRQLVTEQRLIVETHRLQLCAPDEPLMIRADELRLEQVFHNLFQNAIKYSPNGGDVEVQLAREGDRACVAIRDHGIGIPEAALGRLFERFYRASNVEHASVGGLGVGLYVVKELVTLHGGMVDVESQEGQGTTFRVYLPLCANEATAE